MGISFTVSMQTLKKLGLMAWEVTWKTFLVIAYLAFLMFPALLAADLWISGTWTVIVILGTVYGAILYSVAGKLDKTIPLFARLRSSVKEAAKLFFGGIAGVICLVLLVSFFEDEEEHVPTPTPTYSAPTYVAPTYTPSRTQSVPVHYDSSYQYNYRTGYSGGYGYNYDVEGYSDSGDYFYGEIDTQDKYGEGYIYDEDGNEVYVETEWTGYGELEATDEYGNTYEFEVD